MSNTKEYKDNAGEWRLTHKANNGNITLASTEGYKNRKDMQTSMINACIEVIGHYRGELSEDQFTELDKIVKSLRL